jgi:hypothetical protein
MAALQREPVLGMPRLRRRPLTQDDAPAGAKQGRLELLEGPALLHEAGR